MAFDLTVAAITLSGSALSALATLCVMIVFVLRYENQKSLRHALVFNLTLSDFINSLINTISGSIFIKNHKLDPTPLCTFEGFLAQLSVQATDFSILAISIATLLVIKRKVQIARDTRLKTFLVCLSIWVVPLITATTGTALGAMKPVSGNWCWISKDRPDLRYGLTHGWRFAIILITIFIYTYVFWYVTRHFRALRELRSSTGMSGSGTSKSGHERLPSPRTSQELLNYNKSTFSSPTVESHQMGQISNTGNFAAEYAAQKSRQAERDVKRMLMMNGYPIMYVILWIPGLTNRIIEASGSHASNRALQILQCSTQFVGFANAITYGLSGVWKKGK